MLSPLEDREVRLWLEAYEPAVDVEVMAHEVLLRSSRPRHQGAVFAASTPPTSKRI